MANQPRVWSEFRELDRFKKDFDDLFDRFLGGRSRRESIAAPVIECFVEGGKLVVRADLPGVQQKDVEITFSGDQLTIRGRREPEKEEKGRDFTHREIIYGGFERSIKVPPGVKADEIKAVFRNGVLEVTAPVPQRGATRKVPVELEARRTPEKS